MPVTYEIVKAASYLHIGRAIESGNEEFFERMTPEEAQKFKDNIYLDHYGLVMDGRDDGFVTQSELRQVYEAAKIIFGRYPALTSFTYDLDSAADILGSPYEYKCRTPEEWAMVYARRCIQTDTAECSESDDGTVEVVMTMIGDLKAVGVPEDHIKASVSLLCYEHYPLEVKVAEKLGVPCRAPEQWEIDEHGLETQPC